MLNRVGGYRISLNMGVELYANAKMDNLCVVVRKRKTNADKFYINRKNCQRFQDRKEAESYYLSFREEK
jgi:hypothetical protein